MSIEIITNDVWLYFPPPHSREGSSHFITNAVFSPIYICEKPASLAYQERKELQDKPIISHLRPLTQMKYNFIKNFGKSRHKKQSFVPTESLRERKYASSS